MNKKNLVAITSIIFVGVLSRLLPHPPNFTPLTGIALLGAVYYPKKWQSFIIPLIIMFISDIFIGLHPTIPFVYVSFIIIASLGFLLRRNFGWGKLIMITLISSILFYLVTNFGVWVMSNMYPKNFTGLIECYIAGLPFFRNTLIGDLLYTSIFFGLAEVMKKYNIVYTPHHA